MMSQGEAVFQAVSAVFNLENGPVPETTQWTRAQKDQVHDSLLAMYKAGMWMKSSGGTDDVQLKKYIPGLVNNWVRKDTRLNGGNKYQPKRPGSRAGSGDEVLKNLRLLLSVTTDPEAKDKVQAAIDARIAETAKPKQEVNIEMIPEHLRHLVK